MSIAQQNQQQRVYADIELEKLVLSQFIRFDSTLNLSSSYFTTDEAKKLYTFIKKHRKIVKSSEELWDLWSINLVRTNNVDLEKAEKFLQSVYIEDKVSDDLIDYYIEQLKGFAEARILLDIYRKSLREYKNGDVIDARKTLEKGLVTLAQEFPVESISRGEFVSGFADRFNTYNKRKSGEETGRIPTGIKKLDMVINGIAPASVNLIQGETNAGKTFLLQEIAYQSFANLNKVLFITIEMQRIEIETRWDARIAGIEHGKISTGSLNIDQEEYWKSRIREIAIYHQNGGRLATTFIPSHCTVSAIEAEIDYWEEQWNDKIDIVCLDYADLMSSDKKTYSEQDFYGNIFSDLKRLSQTKELAIWTATQFSGKAYNKEITDLADTSYSMKKAFWSNLIINMTTDRNDGIIKLTVVKNTFGKVGAQVVLYSDLGKSLIDKIEQK